MIKTEKMPGRQRNRPIKDHTGIVYGMLTAVHLVERREDKRHKWLFKCECGNEATISVNSVVSGHTKSCGCLLQEVLLKRNTTHGVTQVNKREYRSWKDMRARCNNPRDSDYKDYGGRGIKYCERWNDFSLFLLDMGDRPAGFTLDRIDVNGDYGPDNCRWASDKTQANNKRNNRFVEIDGVTKTLQEWSDIYGIDRSKVRYRLNQGWPVEKAFSYEDFRLPQK